MSNAMTSRHSDAEQLAAFVDGHLDDEELQAVSEHLAECEECRAMIAAAAVFEQEQAARRAPARRWWWWAAAGVAVVVIGGAVPTWRHLTDPLRRLQPGPYRSTPTRLTTFAYAPLRQNRGAGTEENLRRLTAAAELQEELEKDRSTENLHRYALAQMALSNPAEATALLEEAQRRDPRNASIMSDLAAAQCSIGKTADCAENAGKALELDPTLAPAAFNWALSLEMLSNRPAAIKAWQKYLLLDSESGWAQEAREHLTRLRQTGRRWKEDRQLLRPDADDSTIYRIATTYPQHVRYWVQDELIPDYAVTRDAGKLHLLQRIAAARAPADTYLRDLAEGLREPAPALIEGIALFSAGRKAAESRDMDAAGVYYSAAAKRLRQAKSPLGLQAEVFATTTDLYANRTDSATARFRDLNIAFGESGLYPSIAAESEWSRGYLLARFGDDAGALEAHRHALTLAQASHEIENDVAIGDVIAGDLERVGEPQDAERSRIEALRRLDEIDSTPSQRYNAYSQTAFENLRAGRPHLALAFIDSQRSIGRLQEDFLYLAESEMERALALRDINQPTAAAEAIHLARKFAPDIRSSGLRDRVVSYINYINGVLVVRSDPGNAVALFSAALVFWQTSDWHIRTATGLLARGEAYLALHERSLAERDFREGIAEMEKKRAGFQEQALRIAYFERADRLFECLIALLTSEGRYGEALSVTEHKRARALLDSLGAAQVPDAQAIPFTAEEICERVGPSTSIIDIDLLPDRVAVWLIRHGGIRYGEQKLATDEITRHIQHYETAIDDNDESTLREEGRWLFNAFLSPVVTWIRPADCLVIVSDGIIQSIPFASLVTPDGNYLIEAHALLIDPSASTFLRTRTAPATTPVRLLVTAQPSPPGMISLPHAEQEARDAAAIHGGGVVLIGHDVTPEDFLRRASDASLVQFSGHARIDAKHPTRSVLLFEAGSGGTPILTVSQITGAHLLARPLVVLSGCNTGRGRNRSAEGVDSIAMAFLHAGARGVIATLCDIDDLSAANMSRAFHRSLQSGLTAADALRNAQLLILRDKRLGGGSISAWAAPVLIGG